MGDFWGGLAAMLVALPSAIAFGVAVLAPMGSAYVAQGALMGIIGTIVLGVLAALFGGTQRLITTPSAPAAAVLTAFVITLTQRSVPPVLVLVMVTLVTIACGAVQVAFGVLGLGRMIKYIPYPVVSGFSSGVGLIIIVSEVPPFLGTPKDVHFWRSLLSPALWSWQSIVVGTVTVAVMLTAARITRAIPAAILGLLAAMGAYFALAARDHSLLVLAGNKLLIGPLGVSAGSLLGDIASRWKSLGSVTIAQVGVLVYPALTLAVLLSIDTLKTSVVLDALTRTRHDSNRELIGQGIGNITSTLLGGMGGSGQTGATLINLSSGGRTRWSGVMEGIFSLLVFLMLGRLIAWVPIAAVAGILIVIGFRMFDRNSLRLLRNRSTILDFAVILVVIIIAETVSLIAASGVGIGLAILLFIREQVGGSVVRRKMYGNQAFSKQVRLPSEMDVLIKRGDRTAILELQGSLFFGTTDQLYTALEPELKVRDYVILDMARVQSVDVTAAHMLEQIEDMLSERDAFLLFSHLPRNVPTGQDMQGYFDEVGLVRREHHVRTFSELDEALEWVEDRIIRHERIERALEEALDLRQIALFEGRKSETLDALESCMDKRSFKAGEKIFKTGDRGDELFLIRRGAVRVVLPLNGAGAHHLATFGRGDFFGEMAFLDREPRSADAVATTDTDLYVLSRERFDALAEAHHVLARKLLERLATLLAIRLRHTNTELRALEEA